MWLFTYYLLSVFQHQFNKKRFMLWLWFKPLETAICAIALGMIFGSTKKY